MDLSSTSQQQLRQKRKRRPASCRRFRLEAFESRMMLDATSDFYASVAAAQSTFQRQIATENAIFNSTEQTGGNSFASQAQSIGEGLQSDVATDGQSKSRYFRTDLVPLIG
jgi:hypothetical protein